MNVRFAKYLALSIPAVGAITLSVQAALFPSQALFDHSLCCGTGVKGTSAVLHPLADAPARSALTLAVVATASTASASTSAIPTAAPTPAAVETVKTVDSATPPVLEQENGYVKVGFDRLASYAFKVPEFDPAANPDVKPPTGEEQIPGWLKELNGRKAKVTGFMLPTKLEGNLVSEFLLLSDPMMCCYGAVPEMNQWIVIKMKKGGVKPIQDVPVSFYGDLKVGAMFENGYMTGIYAMECDKMGAVEE